MEAPKSRLGVDTKINKYGVSGIVFSVVAFAIPLRYPFCVLMPIGHLCALTCSIVAATRGSKLWLLLSAISALLVIQAVLAVLVEC
jgi:hypothetical protein